MGVRRAVAFVWTLDQAGMVSRGEVKVVGAYYSLQTGQVTITAQPQ